MTKLLYQRILVVLLALIVVFGGWFAADWQLRRAEAAANWTDPKQVLILDAGHGGEDGGAVAPNGTVEADINLQIALRARAIAEMTGIEVVMTRDSPDIAYPDNATTIGERKKADQHQRAELIRKTDNAVLISIHQNCYPDCKPSGAQVLVECGFLSNESECTKLKDGGYQTKLAAVIIASYLQYRQSLPQTGMVT